MDNVVPMGHVIGAFGIQGWVKIKTGTETPDALGKYKEILLLINGNWTGFKLEKYSATDAILHAKFAGITDRDQAIALRGATVGVLRSQLPKPDENEYYWVDLIGLEVVNQKQQSLGLVDSLMETGASSVLVVKGQDKQHLIPFVKHYIINVDFNSKQIISDWELDY